ncbi:MAG: OmpA family protein [Gammaproteobacteria bacterium]|jgi:outer membrane protein OmpA-like peptidoglycan-associated protein|nr:OmpA family protein [Gammaproteobacteria bacterium]MDH3846572.1 OmpA family protein [Gammaproteobacteria bacterium]MDH3863104.1 OmpA family protein [Gammaproteobacteria bacterium]MDH3904685.1 OmpA family protein [Gammaproteobacteria bacterium]MDH3907449.1 OmpA family protein [Gammaproteobacteria bacterium]
MRKTITAITALALITVPPLAAQAAASKKETIGVGAGAIVGAAAGGPVGLIVGAAVGAYLGDNIHQKDGEIQTLTVELAASRSEVVGLEGDIGRMDRDIDTLSAELQRMQRYSSQEMISLLEAGIVMELLFRTDEAVLADSTGSRLHQLATTLAAMPAIRVQLDGFADERGEERYNQQLSEQRVNFIRDQLIAAGVEASRVTATAHGESPAQDDNVDSYALERRVSLKLYTDDVTSFAANPE